MNFNELTQAINDAQRTLTLADNQAHQLAKLLVGRLRSVTKHNNWSDHNILCALKKELTQYNANTRTWKN